MLLNYVGTPRHVVEMPISDNLTQLCYLSLPLESDLSRSGRPFKPVPVVLGVHGGPWSRDHWGYHTFNQYMNNRGYGCMFCNYRSSTGLGKRLTNAGNGEWGRKMQQDLTDAVNWLVANKVARKDKVWFIYHIVRKKMWD